MKKLFTLFLACLFLLTTNSLHPVYATPENGISLTTSADNFTVPAVFAEREQHQLTQQDLSVPTKDLIEIILEYPELIYFITTSNPEHTYRYLRRTYNGIQELEKREDAANVLLSKLAAVSKDETNIIMRTYLSNLLCAPIIFEQLTPIQEKQLLELTGMGAHLFPSHSMVCCNYKKQHSRILHQ